MRWTLLPALLVLLPTASAPADNPAKPSAGQLEFFEARIRPVLAEHCYACHGPKKQRGKLRLDSAAALRKGSEDGPVIVAGHPEKSLLIQAVRQQGEVKMPPSPRPKLSAQAVADLAAWVKMGAPWPANAPGADASRLAPPGADASRLAKKDEEPEKTHWAFQPVKKPALPAVRDSSWSKTPLDRFILAALEAKGLRPSADADRRTWLRRVTFDLIGLPPTAAEVAAFEADQSANAYEKVVDRLLASPHFGERWARYWLDVARYADTKGYVFREERRYPYAYTYRDYVVRAFNEDLPYDRFIEEQLAADRLLAADPSRDRRSLAAMGYLTLGRRFLNNINDIIDDRIDVVSRGLLGLTVSCARCHDHKFDPIPQADYYSLYGVFASSVEPKDLPQIAEPERTPAYLAFEKELKVRLDAVAKYREEHKTGLATGNQKFREELVQLQKKVDRLRATSPAAPPRAMVLVDRPSPVTPHVFRRGNPNRPGPSVPRQFLAVLSGEHRQPFHEGSGRLELARAIASRDNPLTARVFVNRVWLHLFDAGLVRTPSDFGLRSETPSNPDLLDYLAWRFMQDGWSLKKLVRQIVLSRTYRQVSADNAPGLKADPENRLLWRMPRRRLDFEAQRDALLFVSGRLDPKVGGPTVDITRAPWTGRRTLYGFIDRQNLPGLFRTFDFASPDTTSSQRHETTVPQQALFLMNSPFVLQQAKSLAARPEVRSQAQPEQRIRALYRLAYAREPDADEVTLGLRFLEAAAREPGGQLDPWQRYAQVLLLANEFVFVD
jgi:mono/diheme cytochrome c family protein